MSAFELATGYPAVLEAFVAEVDAQVATDLEPRTVQLVRLAALVASDATAAYADVLAAALDDGLDPVAATEVVVHAVPYVGAGRAAAFARATAEVLTARGVELPLPSQASVDADTRAVEGREAQATIVGDVDRLHAQAPADQQHVQRWLTAHCFGDHYTRTGIELRTRELLTLVLIASLGGADAQVAAHVAGNLRVGNDRAVMIAAISAVVPWIGYPRSLNALRAITDGTSS